MTWWPEARNCRAVPELVNQRGFKKWSGPSRSR